MRRGPLLNRLLIGLTLLLGLAPAWGQDVSDLVSSLETAGARVVRVTPGDPRLTGRGVATGVGADGVVEVYLTEASTTHRTPLASPTRRMTVLEHRALAEDIRTAIREVTGVTVDRVMIAGSSSGIPFRDPNSGELRVFDRKGPGTSDYDGAVISEALFEWVRQRRPQAVRGKTTGLRTAPDPVPELYERFKAISAKHGRKVAAMIYPSEVEFEKRMEITGLEVGRNVMTEPPAGPVALEVTRAELLGARVEVELTQRLLEGRSVSDVTDLLERANAGEPEAKETVRVARRAAVDAVRASTPELTEVDLATLKNEAARLAEPSAFAARRGAGPRGPPTAVDAAGAEGVFAEAREAAAARALERAAGQGSPELRAEARALAARTRATRLEVLPTGDLLLDFAPESNAVRVSEGLLAKVEASGDASFRTKALGLLFGHELAHATGIRAEAVADAEAVRAFSRARTFPELDHQDLRETVRLFTRSSSRLSDVLYGLRDLGHGTEGARTGRMARALAGQPDALAEYRRADGTLDWGRVTADKALTQGAGVAHFALSLFLKELAVVVKTGDRLRIDEFFEGLATTDFFVTYGLFSVGAQAGSVAYSRFLARYVKPRFVSGVLRTNVALATGMALADVVQGRFDGETFAINVASLGLSSVAVRAGLEGISWVVNLNRARSGAAAVRTGANLARLARLGGWFYTAAETAVVLYLGDELAQAIHRYRDTRAARTALADATLAFRAALADPTLSDEAFAEALAAYQRAHADWRNFLYRELLQDDALYQGRLEKVAREAKLLADERAALADRLERLPALRRRAIGRYGSVEAYLDAHGAASAAEVEDDLQAAMEAYQRARAGHLGEVYGEGAREGGYLPDDAFLGPAYRLRGLARGVSANRLQAYDDEAEALAAAKQKVAGSSARVAALDAALARVAETRRRDAALFLSEAEGVGISERLREVGAPR